ncbi:MAG: PEP-CTERM sorting domain-containing protein [Planctomycetota bacterium]|nr:PEP-CTERM sorting domain-containing protein [Planctomycetota bacterium]
MRRIIATFVVTLFLALWVPNVRGQEWSDIVPISRTISVSASGVGHTLQVLGDWGQRSCTATGTVNTWDSWSETQVNTIGSVSIGTEVYPWVVQISAAAQFRTASRDLPGSWFDGDASIVFNIPGRAEPSFAFDVGGLCTCNTTLTGPSGQVWWAGGGFDMSVESERPRFLDPGQYTLWMHIIPQTILGISGSSNMTVRLGISPAVPEPATIGLASIGLLLLTRRPRR